MKGFLRRRVRFGLEPAAFKRRVIDRNTAGSSSTRKVVKPASPITHLTGAKKTSPDGWRKPKYCRSSFTHVVLKRERAAVQLYDGSADREAEAKPPLFRRKERLKDALLLRRRQARTTISYADYNSPSSVVAVLTEIVRRAGATPSIASMAFMKRLRRICCSWTGSPRT